ncbi:acyltransferase domain-containing protein [Sphingomonas sp. M1A8_2b]
MTLALLCSGQGRQDRAMLDLFANEPAAARILTEASALLGQDILTLLQTASDADLHGNRTSQILCVARGLAANACLAFAEPYLVAGYSVGEMTAWGVAGIWTPERTLRLTAVRAEAMDAVSGADDCLGFIRGLTREHVDALVARFDCALAIVNPAQLFIIGGNRNNVERCCVAAVDESAVAARPIAVRVASHTKRLSRAVAPFLDALEASEPQRPIPGRTLLGAADASIARGRGDFRGLAAQIDTTVDWASTLEALIERGADRILELGPGSALADMVRATYPRLDVRSVDDFRSWKGVAEWNRRQSIGEYH